MTTCNGTLDVSPDQCQSAYVPGAPWPEVKVVPIASA
jgi:hypothetical protein